jgi:YidC/Oxa1 family membrane protein insertase
MMIMQAMQPEMKKLQARYKDDRQKLNEELLKFYKENNINPLGGCLPLLIQMPVFLVLYRVLRGLTETTPYGWFRHTITKSVVPGFDPAYLNHDSSLYQSLHGQTAMMSWGMDLSRSATQAMRDSGLTNAIPYLILILGVVITSYIQQKQVSGRSPAAQQANPQQQMLLRIMPVFFAFISLNLPAALVVYFFVSNLYRCGQQAFISHKIYKPAMASGGILDTKGKEIEAPAAGTKAGKDAPAKAPAPTGFFSRLLGDAAPRLTASSRASANGNGAAPKSSAKAPARAPGGRTGTSKASTKASPSRPAPGRTTPSGGGPQPRARKKKKRK